MPCDPYGELPARNIPVAVIYDPPNDDLPCDVYVQALPLVGETVTVVDERHDEHDYVVSAVDLQLAARGRYCGIYTLQLRKVTP